MRLTALLATRASTPRLWTPLEVNDFDASAEFYGGMLGLPLIESWEREGERGAIYGLGDGQIEIVQTDTPTRPPSIAIELSTWDEVDALGPGAQVFPRGHYGFVTHDPDGNGVLVWSEAEHDNDSV